MSNLNVVKLAAAAGIALGIVAGIVISNVALSLNQAFTTAAHHPDDIMRTGTVYAGLSPRTQEPLYVPPQDAPDAMNWHKAKSYCDQLEAHGHKDWRLPDREDLNLIFENSAAIGGFNKSGSFPAGWYWSSSEILSINARHQRFSDGFQGNSTKSLGIAVRCVRG